MVTNKNNCINCEKDKRHIQCIHHRRGKQAQNLLPLVFLLSLKLFFWLWIDGDTGEVLLWTLWGVGALLRTERDGGPYNNQPQPKCHLWMSFRLDFRGLLAAFFWHYLFWSVNFSCSWLVADRQHKPVIPTHTGIARNQPRPNTSPAPSSSENTSPNSEV